MSFHEALFPVYVSYGTQGGAGFPVHVTETDSGQETRVATRARPRRRYNAAKNLETHNELGQIAAFHLARGGKLTGFRMKDWTDYNTTAVGRSWGESDDSGMDPTAIDQVLGYGDGARQVFQLLKRYDDGFGYTHVRTITKPVEGSVKVAVDGSQVFAFSVDSTTGRVSLATPPATSAVVTAGCEFDVPVRFGDGVEDALSITVESFGHGKIPDIPLIELLDDELWPEDRLFGGAKFVNVGSAAGASPSFGTLVWTINPGASGKKVFLPDLTGLPTGGAILVLVNADLTNSMVVQRLTALGGSTYADMFTLGAASTAELCIAVDGNGDPFWIRTA